MNGLNSILQLPNIWFYIFAAGILFFALRVVLSKNIVHCAMYLAAAFIGVAAVYILLDAAFLAAVQVLIYVGAVTVLILFAVLLSHKYMGGAAISQHNSQSIPAAALCAVFIWAIVSIVGGPLCCYHATQTPAGGTAAEIGLSLLSWYVVPFEIASLLLLAAMIGAIIIAKQDKD